MRCARRISGVATDEETVRLPDRPDVPVPIYRGICTNAEDEGTTAELCETYGE